jgi:hypothetical protein
MAEVTAYQVDSYQNDAFQIEGQEQPPEPTGPTAVNPQGLGLDLELE